MRLIITASCTRVEASYLKTKFCCLINSVPSRWNCSDINVIRVYPSDWLRRVFDSINFKCYLGSCIDIISLNPVQYLNNVRIHYFSVTLYRSIKILNCLTLNLGLIKLSKVFWRELNFDIGRDRKQCRCSEIKRIVSKYTKRVWIRKQLHDLQISRHCIVYLKECNLLVNVVWIHLRWGDVHLEGCRL